MSFISLISNDFDTVSSFYEDDLLCPLLLEWNRPSSRGKVYDLYGLRLEIIDGKTAMEKTDFQSSSRCQLVVEVDDIEKIYHLVKATTSEIKEVSWGAKMFFVKDPENQKIWFIEWANKPHGVQ